MVIQPNIFFVNGSGRRPFGHSSTSRAQPRVTAAVVAGDSERRDAGRESPTSASCRSALPPPPTACFLGHRVPHRGSARRSVCHQFASSFCRRRRGAQYGVESSPQPPRPDPDATDPERPPPALPSELLEDVLFRVASPADLARAAAACVSFRRIIADHAFLRRYRSINPPLLLGFVTPYGLDPAEAPHSSAAVARAVEFSIDYLPPTTGWDNPLNPVGARDGRVLLERSCCRPEDEGPIDFFDWVYLVCDPLSRRYMLLPPITDDLLASIRIENQNIFHFGASFICLGGTEGDTSFSVISWIQSSSRLGVLIFSSGSGWSVSTSISWDDLGLDGIYNFRFRQPQYTSDCVYWKFDYWKLNGMSRVVKLDLNSLQFYTIGLPPSHERRDIVIVESGETGVAMFSAIFPGTFVDYYTFPQNGSEKSHEWHLKSTIPLPAHYDFEDIIGAPAEGYIFIECTTTDEMDSAVFSLEIESFNIERAGRIRYAACGAHPYFGFPPSMSPRRI